MSINLVYIDENITAKTHQREQIFVWLIDYYFVYSFLGNSFADLNGQCDLCVGSYIFLNKYIYTFTLFGKKYCLSTKNIERLEVRLSNLKCALSCYNLKFDCDNSN